MYTNLIVAYVFNSKNEYTTSIEASPSLAIMDVTMNKSNSTLPSQIEMNNYKSKLEDFYSFTRYQGNKCGSNKYQDKVVARLVPSRGGKIARKLNMEFTKKKTL